MKRLLMLLPLLTLVAPSQLFSQDEEETLTTYFVDTPITVYISSSSIPSCQAALSFDLETINEDGFLDVAFGRAIGSSGPNRYGIENYNNGSGEFPNGDAEFFFRLGYCEVPSQINNLVFGKLRSNVPRKDLAFLCDDSTFIFLNTGNGMEAPRNQALVGKATDGSWGAFDYTDDYEDLVVTNGANEVRIYRSLNNGTVDANPIFTSSIAATKVVLAQLNKSIYEANETNKWDLVSFYGDILSIRLNDNNNGFNSPDTINIGDGISDVAVGDLNDDGYNDIVVASYSNGSVQVAQ